MVLKHVLSMGQNTIAERMGTSETTVSRIISVELERVCKVLAVLDVKVVPSGLKCYRPAQINALLTLAKVSMDGMDSAEQLSFED